MELKDYYIFNTTDGKRYDVSLDNLHSISSGGGYRELYRDLGPNLRPLYCGTVTNYYSDGNQIYIKLHNYETEENDTYTFSI